MKATQKAAPHVPAKSHPAYGHIYIGRQHGPNRHLFGAVGPTCNSISIEISQVEISKRETDEEEVSLPSRRLIAVSMSELQFAELLGTLNYGGTACTITYLLNERIPDIPEPTSPLEVIRARFQAEMRTLNADCAALCARARELQEKPTVTKGDRTEFTKIAENMALKITSVQPYIVGKFAEAASEIMAHLKMDAHPGQLPKSAPETIPDWLLAKTFAVQHNPNCPKPFLVRLPGKSAALDMLPYDKTGDILGFGDTLREAAESARVP